MKTAILITARLKSTRLPMKVIKPIKDRPMISHMVDRLKLSTKTEQIIICTSSIPQDDPLVQIAHQENVDVFRGDPDDVLHRITKTAEDFGVDTVVSCTADNPFVDPYYIDRLVDFHHENNHDFSKTEGLPFGTFAYTLSYPAMVRACEVTATNNTEFWGGYFTQTGLFNWGTMSISDPDFRWPDLRLTVDTPEDFELITRIFDELYEPDKVFPLVAILELCRQRTDLTSINASIAQLPPTPIITKLNMEAKYD